MLVDKDCIITHKEDNNYMNEVNSVNMDGKIIPKQNTPIYDMSPQPYIIVG